MAKNKWEPSVNDWQLTAEQIAEINDIVNKSRRKDKADYYQDLVTQYENANYQRAMAEKYRNSDFDKQALSNLNEILGNNTSGYASEDMFGRTFAERLIEQMRAGIDIYSDPDNIRYMQFANANGWSLPTIPGIDYNQFVRNYQDELYNQRVSEAGRQSVQTVDGNKVIPKDTAQWNFGLDANNLPKGIDEATLQRNAMLPQIPVREDTPEETAYLDKILAAMQEHPEMTGDQIRALVGEESPFIKTSEPETPVEHQYGVLGNVGTLGTYNPYTTGDTQNAYSALSNAITPYGARNNTTGWLSDEYEDINTRTVGNAGSGVQWTQAGQDYRDQLAAAMSGNSAASTGTAYQDYLAGLSAQGGANAGYSRPSGTSYRAGSAGGKRSLTPDIQRQAYQSMLDALVRGSNGGMPTTNGFGAANRIYDNMRAEITDPKPVYEQYGAYRGNTLTRDKDYDYLNRLLNVKK